MELSLVALATLLLLLPGVGFISGVNLADKNVREIVFRNTPAEFGYVIFVSLTVHLLFLILSFAIQYFFSTSRWLFDVAGIAAAYSAIAKTEPNGLILSQTGIFLTFVLSYFLIAAIAGFVPGYVLGRAIPRRDWTIFAKHRWMLALAGLRQKRYVFARARLVSDFPPVNSTGHSSVSVEGFLSDCYFDSTGALLYLVFRNFTEKRKAEAGFIEVHGSDSSLVIEGRHVAMAEYSRINGLDVSDQTRVDRLRQLASENKNSVYTTA